MLPLSENNETALSLTGKLSVVFMMVFVAILIFAEPDWMENQIQSELNDFVSMAGEESGEKVIARATNWYTLIFKDTGAESTINKTIGYDNNAETNEGIRDAGADFSRGIAKSLKTFWLMMYQSMFRLSVLSYWLVFFGAIVVASAVDGYIKRRIKQHNFGWTSVNVFRMSAKILVFCPFAILTYITFPIIPAEIQLLPIAILLVVAIAVHHLVSNTQKLF